MVMSAHDEQRCSHNTPHVHILFKTQDVPFTFQGQCLLPKGSPFKGNETKFIKEWIQEHLVGAIKEWNKNNPNLQVDDKGNVIN